MSLGQVPNEISFNEVANNTYSLSPLMYKKVQINNANKLKMSEVTVKGNYYEKGNEPGSQWYVKDSNTYLIRTKALQDFSYLVYPKGESIVSINPKKYIGCNLKRGDILLSKDSNIGEVAIVCDNECKGYDFSSGIVKLNISEKFDPFYVFACLKHNSFKEQLISMCPKGATIKHAGERWMDCYIAFPSQDNAEKIISYISDLVKIVMKMERIIADKSQHILEIISQNLLANQKRSEYVYGYPTFDNLKKEKRLDAAIYCKEYKDKIHLIENYKDGYYTPSEYGFTVIPGPSLEIKILKTRVDSEEYISGFYNLLLPTNISEFGTINKIQYLGTKKSLPLLKKGDILFGEAGFQKGRSIVLVDEIENCTTNAHGLYARRDDIDLKKSIFFRCIFDWYRNMKLIDLMAVGGSGGHFSPEYFDYIRIPKFPNEVIDEIVNEYSCDLDFDYGGNVENLKKIKLNDYGIVQLDKEAKLLKNHINELISMIINGEKLEV